MGKEKKKLNQNSCPTYDNLLIARDLWQVHYQILLLISLKEFVGLNVNTVMIMKKSECRIKYKDCECDLEYVNVKDDLIYTDVFVLTRITKKSLT